VESLRSLEVSMTADIEDLTPFCRSLWMFVLLPRGSVGVILRRGQAMVHVTLWTREPTSSERSVVSWRFICRYDVSPNGKLFIYFAGNFASGCAKDTVTPGLLQPPSVSDRTGALRSAIHGWR